MNSFYCGTTKNAGLNFCNFEGFSLAMFYTRYDGLKHIFFWRLACSFHPTQLNLRNQNIKCQSNCVRCSHTVEDEIHIFLECAYVVNCWNEANLWNTIKTVYKYISHTCREHMAQSKTWLWEKIQDDTSITLNLSFDTLWLHLV